MKKMNLILGYKLVYSVLIESNIGKSKYFGIFVLRNLK